MRRYYSFITGIICAAMLVNFGRLDVKAAKPEGLAAHYIFNEESTKTIKDYSGNGRDLTIDGKGLFGEGKEGKAFEFDGSTILKLPKNKAISGENITIAAFVNIKGFYTGDNGATNLFVNNGISALGKGAVDFAFDQHHKLTSYICGNSWLEGDRVTDPNAQSTLNTWIHVAVVYDQDSEKQFLYVNGKKVAENTMVKGLGMPVQLGFKATGGSSGDEFLIGGYSNGKEKIRTFKGLMDDVRIYTRALESSEIEKISNDKDALTEYKNYGSEDKNGETKDKPQKENSGVSKDDEKSKSELKGSLPYVITISVLSLSLIGMIAYIVVTNPKKNEVVK